MPQEIAKPPSRTLVDTLFILVWKSTARDSGDGPSSVHRSREDAVKHIDTMRSNSPLHRERHWQTMDAHILEVTVSKREVL